jgi:antitoxin component of MazEF toxin-antitoxin module
MKMVERRKYKVRYNLAENKIKVKRTLVRNGCSYSVNIPPQLIKKLDLTDNLILEEDGNRIIIYKAG